MTKEEFKTKIKAEIANGNSIKQDFEQLKAKLDPKVNPFSPRYQFDESKLSPIRNELIKWEKRVLTDLINFFGVLKEFTFSEPDKWTNARKEGAAMMEKNIVALESYLDRLDSIATQQDEDKSENKR